MRLGAACLALCLAAGAATNATHVVVGQTVDLSSPFAEFGQSSRAGLQAAFCEANAPGGVLGRQLALVTLDDGNDPATAQQNFQLLTAAYNVSVLAATYAMDTFGALLPLVTQANLPYVGPHVGTPDTRSPFTRPVVNVRASWADEIATHAKLLVETLRVQRIACFYERDDWGDELFPFLASILQGVGLQLVASGAFSGNDTTILAAAESILNASARAQAVLLLAEEGPVLRFLQLFRKDARADPNCTFHILSVGASPSFAAKAGPAQWPNLFFTQVIPSPDSSQVIARRYTSLPPACLPAQYRTDAMAFEAYIVGRLIAEVLRQMDSKYVSPADILDRVYTSRLFYLDDLPLGLYMDNHTGCDVVLCGCNAGLRKVFVSTLDMGAGTFTAFPAFPGYQYSVTECAAPTTLHRPILFGQLIPVDDPVATAIALAIQDGIQDAYDEEVNAGGGLMGHLFELVSVPYSGDPVVAAQALLDRYPLTAFLGCVVPDADAVQFPALAIGTYGWTPHVTDPAFRAADLRVQPSAPLELMALVGYAAAVSPANLHFRIRANFSPENFTDVLIETAHTFQLQPRTVSSFTQAADALSGLTDGFVVALGTDADLVQWVNLLVTRPRLTLLTLSTSVHRLVAANLSTTTATYPQIVFPSVSRGVTDFAEAASATDYWLFGHLLGHLSGYALTQQYLDVQFISPTTMMDVWYQARLIKQRNVMVGPYYANACSVPGTTDCGCNLGARNLWLINPNNTLPEVYTYSSSTCRVVYLPLVVPTVHAAASIVLPVALGASLGVAGVTFLLWWVARYGQRNNRSAPKDPSQPFCVLFTDIQSSTTLWASIPDVMAGALDTHHRIIRRLIARHQCYEVKTIGDSFMCATKSPVQALRFSLAVQEEFAGQKWGTDRIDLAYAEMVLKDASGPGCWNGLRVRIGIHYGLGDIKLDPVSKGYDYYGTVVNTAARIEGVCHGGQIGVSEAVFTELGGSFPGAIITDLGHQPLRGLAEPLRLYQVLPEGALSERRFPPLRIDRADGKEEALAAKDPDPALSAEHPRHSVVPTSVSESSLGLNGRWIEVHPLVVRGDITAEDLRRHYNVLQTGISTLLVPMSKAFRHQMVKEMCARLHVPNHGLEGPQLRSTLHGLIQRVLPATVTQQPQFGRQVSTQSDLFSSPSLRLSHLSPKTGRAMPRMKWDKHQLSQGTVSTERADSTREL